MLTGYLTTIWREKLHHLSASRNWIIGDISWNKMVKRQHGPLITTHLLGLLLVIVVLPIECLALIDTSVAPTFALRPLMNSALSVDCKDAMVRFDEPCRCYRLPGNSTTYLLDCDGVAFQFFPAMPQNISLHMASFRDVGYQGLPTELFRGRNSGLRALDLSNNHFLTITTSSLTGLENSLEFLNLSQNNLGRNFQPLLDIPEIHRLRALRVLDLSSNGIKLISEQFFSGLTATLEEIYLNGNDLTEIQFLGSVQTLVHLKILDLSENRLFRIESLAFGSLPSLEFLDLADNFLSMMLPTAFNGTALKRLNLRRNRMQAIDHAVFGGVEASLTDLDLSFNVLRTVTDLRSFQVLSSLNMSSNILQNFNEPLPLPPSINVLDLSGNHLTFRSIPYISPLPALHRFVLARNFLNDFFDTPGLVSAFSYPFLEHLDLRSTNLSSVPSPLFPLLPRLRSLDLSYNTFSELSADSFSGASQLLETLNVAHCRLQSWTDTTWLPLPNLQSLDLSSNSLTNSGDLLSLPKSIRSLEIGRNNFSTLPDFQFATPNLVQLDASSNILTKVELNLLPTSTLRRLDLSGNLLTSIPAYATVESRNASTTEHTDYQGVLGWLMTMGDRTTKGRSNQTSALEMMDLSWNRISAVERPLVGLGNLTVLNLSGNKIGALPAGFLRNMDQLEMVNLSRNLLTGLENSTFSNLSRLTTLDLSYNRLKTFSGNAMAQLTRLEILLVTANQLAAVTPKNTFLQFPFLETVSLSQNRLSNISYEIFNGTAIRRLDLSHNHLFNMNNMSLGWMPLLRSLDLSGNNLTRITGGAFAYVPQLQDLDISQNGLRNVPDEMFRGIRRLSLDLSGNKLENLPYDLFTKSKVDRLEELNLADNHLTVFPDRTLFEQDYNLVTLNLAGNRISEIPAGSLISTKNVDLSRNPLSEQAIQTVLSDPKTTFTLNMARVGMANFPPVQLQFLTSLNLSGNHLMTFGDPLNWQRASLLESLDLSDNQLTDLRDSLLVWVLPKFAFLKWLDLSGNPLKAIRENELSGLINVDYLDVSSLPKLETFDISNLLEFPRLRTLRVATYPRLANFPVGDISSQLPALRHVDLELNSPILTSQLQGMLTPSLESLTLTGPIVTRITRDTFGTFNPGERFHLDLNNLGVNSLPADIFQRFPRATRLELGVRKTQLNGADIAALVQSMDLLDGTQFTFLNNKLDCTCNASAILATWMGVKDSIRSVQCDMPSEMTGQSVLELDMTDLPCLRPAGDGSGVLPPPPSRGNTRMRLPFFSQLPTDDGEQFHGQPAESEIIFEVTSTRTSLAQNQPPTSSLHLEGAIAGIVVGLLLLTALMIGAIIFWFRRERNRQSAQKTLPKGFQSIDGPYAVIPNTDVVAHPTWYPPPQPVLILPGRGTPSGESQRGRFISPEYPLFDEAGYFERGLYDVPYRDGPSRNASRVMDGDFSDYARTSYAGKSIVDEETKDNQSEKSSFTANSCDMTFTFESVFTPSTVDKNEVRDTQQESVIN